MQERRNSSALAMELHLSCINPSLYGSVDGIIIGPGARFTNDFFARNSNSMETSPCCNSVAGHQIATNFCTCHDSTAVVPCTKFCSDHSIRLEMRVKQNFHRIWNATEKPLVKRGPGQHFSAKTIPKSRLTYCQGLWENEGTTVFK